MSFFDNKIQEMIASGASYTEPCSFRDYCRKFSLSTGATASYISIDSYSSLRPELKVARCMVFRLGRRSGGSGTHFALSKCQNGWDDFFLFDDKLFNNCPEDYYIPRSIDYYLYPFRLLSILSENSLINFAIASGLMSHALNLNLRDISHASTSGQSTFTFSFKPNSLMPITWDHISGQVEIDCIFTANRNGKSTVFVLEAKSGSDLGSLAKHKLFYPVLSILPRIPKTMDIVPVYMRAYKKGSNYHFNFAECLFKRSSSEVPVLSELSPIKSSSFVVKSLGF